MQIYIAKGEEQTGPFTLKEAREKLAQGAALPDDLAWHEGLDDWVPVSTLIKADTPAPTESPNSFGKWKMVLIAVCAIVLIGIISVSILFLTSNGTPDWDSSGTAEWQNSNTDHTDQFSENSHGEQDSSISDPGKSANELFVEAVKLIGNAVINVDNFDRQGAIKNYEKAMAKINIIINERPESDIAVKLLSNEKVFLGLSFGEVLEELKNLKLNQRKRERSKNRRISG